MVERMISSEENWCEVGQLDAINNKVKSENHNLREKWLDRNNSNNATMAGTLRKFVGQSYSISKGSEGKISISEVCAIETQKLQVETIKHVIKNQNQRVLAAGAGKKHRK
jgi:hypothetical protein